MWFQDCQQIINTQQQQKSARAMKSYEWVKRVKAEKGLKSDNQAAIALGLNRAAISQHKSGKVKAFDDETCQRIADLLGIDVTEVLIDQHAEGAKSAELRKVWQNLGKMVSGGVMHSPIILGVLIFQFSSKIKALPSFDYLHYMLCKIDESVLFPIYSACNNIFAGKSRKCSI